MQHLCYKRGMICFQLYLFGQEILMTFQVRTYSSCSLESFQRRFKSKPPQKESVLRKSAGNAVCGVFLNKCRKVGTDIETFCSLSRKSCSPIERLLYPPQCQMDYLTFVFTKSFLLFVNVQNNFAIQPRLSSVKLTILQQKHCKYWYDWHESLCLAFTLFREMWRGR